MAAPVPIEPQGLRYVSDQTPGIRRKRSGKGFTYVDDSGNRVSGDAVLKRIRSLVIPPAWTNVWICASANGHLQAVGRDARGRKQYRYHPLFRRHREETKFNRMLPFAHVLPRIRARVKADLRLPGLPKEKVMATLLKLLDRTAIRIGNEEYVRQNGSFGLTTLRNKHVQINKTTMRFRFRGKSGQLHEVTFEDRRVARVVRDCQCLPGQDLFAYLDDNGEVAGVCSQDVNDYIRAIAGDEFTAKDFRTWKGTVEMLVALESMGPATSETQARKNISEAVKITAAKLGNKPAACRAHYIHPVVIEAYAEGRIGDGATIANQARRKAALRPEERATVALIRDAMPAAPARKSA